VAVLEARLGGELAALVRRRGGEPVCAPAVVEEETDVPGQLASLLASLGGAPDALVVFTTGAGVASLFRGARENGREPELRALLARATLACRGPKPAAALGKEGLAATIRAADPYTETELIAALAPLPLSGRALALVHHGERSPGLAAALAGRGARLVELTLYAWRLPGDREPLRRLVEELEGRRVDAVLFTSQVQARHLFAVAEELGRGDALRAALGRTVVASVGPTCTRALEAFGVRPRVTPERSKMGALVAALEQHLTEAGRHA
jgi:uroporphyrinogen-III synthase